MPTSSVISAGCPKTASRHWDRKPDYPQQAFEDCKHQKTDAGTHYRILRNTQLPAVISEGSLLPQGVHPNEIGMDSIARKSINLQGENSTIFNQQVVQLDLRNQWVRQVMAPCQFAVPLGTGHVELGQDLHILFMPPALKWAEVIRWRGLDK